MSLSVGEIEATFRSFLAEPSSSGRYPEADVLNDISLAAKQVMLRVEWPEATFTAYSDGANTLFTLPELTSLLRVYVAGQPCVPTSIPLLEGDQIGQYDSHGPLYTPAWTQATFTGYPQAEQQSSPSTVGSLPYFVGQRPGYYARGGALGIVPPPTAGYPISIDCYPAVPTFTQNTQSTFFPEIFNEAISWRAIMYALFSKGDSGSGQFQSAAQGYEDQVTNVLKPWKTKLWRALPTPTQIPVPHRTYFRGPYRGPRSGGRFGG